MVPSFFWLSDWLISLSIISQSPFMLSLMEVFCLFLQLSKRFCIWSSLAFPKSRLWVRWQGNPSSVASIQTITDVPLVYLPRKSVSNLYSPLMRECPRCCCLSIVQSHPNSLKHWCEFRLLTSYLHFELELISTWPFECIQISIFQRWVDRSMCLNFFWRKKI